jgi:DNA-binding NarL/FixJ family response regulator
MADTEDSMRPIFCFIDDSPFELDVFLTSIAPSAQGIEMITGHTYVSVKKQLEDRHPCLFLLDLYGKDDQLGPVSIPRQDELQKEVAAIKSLDDVYEGLDQFEGDQVNEYLKRLFHVSDSWRRLFYRASRKAGQNINYGLRNLESVKRDYTAAAAVAYTRKSMIMDAVEVLEAGIDGLSLKPDGPDDKAIKHNTTLMAPQLLETWSELVTHRFAVYLKDLIVLLLKSGFKSELPRLLRPETMSTEIRAMLGPGDMGFLTTAASWWDYTGHPPLL